MALPQVKLPAPDPVHQVRQRSLKHTVELYIRDLIFNGHLLPGERIDQDAIADTLGVSKLPVREALAMLETAALVDVIPRRGAFVARISRDDLIDHYRIYASISAIAAERAAAKLDSAALAGLKHNVAEMDAATSADDREKLNHEFHRIINKAGGSRRLHVLLRSLETMMFGEFYRDDSGWSAQAVADHASILEALERGDGKAAAEHMDRHIVDGGTHAISLLEQQGFWHQ